MYLQHIHHTSTFCLPSFVLNHYPKNPPATFIASSIFIIHRVLFMLPMCTGVWVYLQKHDNVAVPWPWIKTIPPTEARNCHGVTLCLLPFLSLLVMERFNAVNYVIKSINFHLLSYSILYLFIVIFIFWPLPFIFYKYLTNLKHMRIAVTFKILILVEIASARYKFDPEFVLIYFYVSFLYPNHTY